MNTDKETLQRYLDELDHVCRILNNDRVAEYAVNNHAAVSMIKLACRMMVHVKLDFQEKVTQ